MKKILVKNLKRNICDVCGKPAEYSVLQESGKTILFCQKCLPSNDKMKFIYSETPLEGNSRYLIDGRKAGFKSFNEFGIKPKDNDELSPKIIVDTILDEIISFEIENSKETKFTGIFGEKFTGYDTPFGIVRTETGDKKLNGRKIKPQTDRVKNYFYDIPKVWNIKEFERAGQLVVYVLRMDHKKYFISYNGIEFNFRDEIPSCISYDCLKYKIKNLYFKKH